MANSDIERALLIVGETLTKITYPKDKSVAMLFGDAGGAVLLEREKKAKIQGLLRTDGSGYRAIIAPAGGFRNLHADARPMMWDDGNERTLFNTYMNGTDVFNFSISDVPEAIRDFLAKTHTEVSDYGYYIMHQANYYIHKQLSKKLKMPLERMPVCLDRFGNSSAAALPLTLCDRFGKSNEGNIKTLMCGFGVGLSWGVISATLDTACIYPIIETDDVFTEGIINTPEDFKKKG
jgi:3-oxoacyl-[acyl-carrier-protein] synthase-3